jgi:hypothetical protein
MGDEQRIRGKVAAVLSKRELILNVGSDDGVELGMKFVILNSHGVDVTDPDTGKVLGTVEVPKTVVKVVRVDDSHLSVARTFRTVKGTPGLASHSSSLTGSRDRVETLDIESGASLKAELSEAESYVKRGGVALETRGDEYDDL